MRRVLVAMAAFVAVLGQVATAEAITLPAGFADEPVTTVGAPTAFAFTPDGRLLITTQSGTVRVTNANGAPLVTALTLGSRVCSNSERGLLGIAVDPAFATNHFVYLYYTFNKFNTCTTGTVSTSPVNRVARFVLGDNNVIDLASEVVLIDNMLSFAGNHNAGDLHFGKDGNLYVSVGDGGCDYAGSGCAGSNDAARERFTLLGKILRITPSGAIPPDNPWVGQLGAARCNVNGSIASGLCLETYAWGLRNPFRIAFDPNAAGTRFYINDVGQNVWEEIDEGVSGADYGWNVREGHCVNGSATNCGAPPAGMTNPIFDYGRSDGCASITGGAFVPNGSAWPAGYAGTYLFADYVCGRIFQLVPNGTGGFNRLIFADALGGSSATHLGFGPHPTAGTALYYASYAGGGAVRRIVFAGANTPPTADVTASPLTGSAPLIVSFNGSGSSDPNAGDTLTYVWSFGDGSPPVETASATTSHQYTANGTYTASLTVRDNHGATSSPDTVRIDVGNTPPVPTITSPAAGQRFAVGETIALRGSATDAQDGALADSRLSWSVVRRHDTHTHPYLGPLTGNTWSVTGPAPEDLLATTNSSIEVQLTATDSSGVSATVTRIVQPKLVNLSFTTKPSKLTLTLNGTSFTAPRTWVSWEAWDVTVNAPDQGRNLFQSWSDGGARQHVIHTPATATTYSATFRKR